MAHTHYTEPGLGIGKLVCNPLVPSPIPFPIPGFSVVCTIKEIIYKPHGEEEHAILLYRRDQKILTGFYNGGLWENIV